MSGNRTLEGRNAIIAEKMMRNISGVLNKCNIPYILEAGTLLGVIRESRLLPWDNDVDFAITEENELGLLKNLWRLKLRFLKVRVKYYTKDLKYFKKGDIRIIKIKNMPLKKKNEVIVDIFIKKKIGDEYFWTEGLNPPVLKNSPANYYENLTSHTFNGKNYLIPKEYCAYLEYRYGKDWQTPIKEWDFRKNDCSIREVL